eukprot:1781826-Pyramimonas_sp.AAC.1
MAMEQELSQENIPTQATQQRAAALLLKRARHVPSWPEVVGPARRGRCAPRFDPHGANRSAGRKASRCKGRASAGRAPLKLRGEMIRLGGALTNRMLVLGEPGVADEL